MVNAAPTPKIEAVLAIAGPLGIEANGRFDDQVHARLNGILLTCTYNQQLGVGEYIDFLDCLSTDNLVIREILDATAGGEAITSRLELYYDNKRRDGDQADPSFASFAQDIFAVFR